MKEGEDSCYINKNKGCGNFMFTKENFKNWAKAAGIRALKTFAQTIVATISVGVAINEIDWITILSIASLAAICSILTSIAGLPEVKEGDKNE